MLVTVAKNGAHNTFERQISRLFNEALGNLDWEARDSAGASWVPPVDIFEQPDAIRITSEIPGVKPDNVKISLENNVLTIHGSKEQVAQERMERYTATSGRTEPSSAVSRCLHRGRGQHQGQL